MAALPALEALHADLGDTTLPAAVSRSALLCSVRSSADARDGFRAAVCRVPDELQANIQTFRTTEELEMQVTPRHLSKERTYYGL